MWAPSRQAWSRAYIGGTRGVGGPSGAYKGVHAGSVHAILLISYLTHSLLTISFSLDSTPPLPWSRLRPPRFCIARRGRMFSPSSTTASTPPPSRGRASRGWVNSLSKPGPTRSPPSVPLLRFRTRAGGAVGTRTPPSNTLSPAPSPISLASKSESEVAVLPSFCQRASSPPLSLLPPPSRLVTPS